MFVFTRENVRQLGYDFGAAHGNAGDAHHAIICFEDVAQAEVFNMHVQGRIDGRTDGIQMSEMMRGWCSVAVEVID